MDEISSMPGLNGYNCEGDDEPGYSIIDNETLSQENNKNAMFPLQAVKCTIQVHTENDFGMQSQ